VADETHCKCAYIMHTVKTILFSDRDGLRVGHYHARMRIWHNDSKHYENAKSLLCNREKAETTARTTGTEHKA